MEEHVENLGTENQEEIKKPEDDTKESGEETDEFKGEEYDKSQDDNLEDDSDWSEDDSELEEHSEGSIPKTKTVPSEEDMRLSWLVDDFDGITENIYEAIIVAGQRARQIGRRQKQEIDDLNSSMEVVDLINNEEEEGMEPGVDHFHHMKPTMQAMKELKSQSFTFSYPDDEIDDEEEE